MALTRIPAPYLRARSTASQRVKLSTAPFAAEYPAMRVSTRCAAIDEIATIDPVPTSSNHRRAEDLARQRGSQEIQVADLTESVDAEIKKRLPFR